LNPLVAGIWIAAAGSRQHWRRAGARRAPTPAHAAKRRWQADSIPLQPRLN